MPCASNKGSYPLPVPSRHASISSDFLPSSATSPYRYYLMLFSTHHETDCFLYSSLFSWYRQYLPAPHRYITFRLSWLIIFVFVLLAILYCKQSLAAPLLFSCKSLQQRSRATTSLYRLYNLQTNLHTDL